MRQAAAIVATAAVLGMAGAEADPADARPVSLTDAKAEPSFLQAIKPGQGYADLRQCGRELSTGPSAWYSDFHAYRWNGRALGQQRTRSDGTRYWRDRRGGRVTFDGLVWQNRTKRTVLVAGWCD